MSKKNKVVKVKASNKWLAIVCAYRKEETELEATLASAAESAGDIATIIAVEDKDGTGPGRNRDRGIMAAPAGSEVIIIIDAHMRFQGDVLARMAEQVREKSGLLAPICHHNDTMSFESPPYTGAMIKWAAEDHTPRFAPLAAKWCKTGGPGPRNAIMGACYAFRRQWYVDAGQPLAMLPGWGGDEEALSIAAWMCGEAISIFDGHVSHLYRAKQPWNVPSLTPVALSRVSLVQAFVMECGSRGELMQHIRRNSIVIPDKHPLQVEIDRVKAAMLKQVRTFKDWRREVCDREEVYQETPESEEKKTRIQNPIAVRAGITCPHCHTTHDSIAPQNCYPNGNKRHICPACRNPFVSIPPKSRQIMAIAI